MDLWCTTGEITQYSCLLSDSNNKSTTEPIAASGNIFVKLWIHFIKLIVLELCSSQKHMYDIYTVLHTKLMLEFPLQLLQPLYWMHFIWLTNDSPANFKAMYTVFSLLIKLTKVNINGPWPLMIDKELKFQTTSLLWPLDCCKVSQKFLEHYLFLIILHIWHLKL